jgi:hypothetical protein
MIPTPQPHAAENGELVLRLSTIFRSLFAVQSYFLCTIHFLLSFTVLGSSLRARRRVSRPTLRFCFYLSLSSIGFLE